MIGFKQIEVTDKEILNRFFDSQKSNQISDSTFTNLFMWRRCYAVRWAAVESHLIVEPNAFESSWILPPYGYDEDDHNFKAALLTMAKAYRESGKPFIIRGVTEAEKERIERVMPDAFEFEDERNIADYIYNAEDLRTLKGRKYSKKRNHINAFHRDYPDYQFQEITMDDVPEVLDFLEHWYGQMNLAGRMEDSLLCEREAIYDALTKMEQLDFVGAMIRIDGKICALTFGEKITDNTVVIHIEKAYAEYRGLYAVINQDYLNHFWPDIEFVNREEDMGSDGLRQAKMSYFPAYLLSKYKAELKADVAV